MCYCDTGMMSTEYDDLVLAFHMYSLSFYVGKKSRDGKYSKTKSSVGIQQLALISEDNYSNLKVEHGRKITVYVDFCTISNLCLAEVTKYE